MTVITTQKNTLLQNIVCTFILITFTIYASQGEGYSFKALIFRVVTRTIGFIVIHNLWHYLDIHRRFGPWKISEPKSHLDFAMKSSWIVCLFQIGSVVTQKFFGVDSTLKERFLNWQFVNQFFESKNNLVSDVMLAVVIFYMTDFMRYWAHRIGHWSFFFKTFPFSHAHHHNQVFLNPLITTMSPLFHLAQWASYAPPALFACFGYHRAAIIAFLAAGFPNLTQHLGCDPFPWLTRWNHYYFFGALPWIPHYHSYHHNPFIKTGNFGNGSVLFDYLFDSVQPESIYHIEHGAPHPHVMERFKSDEKLDKILKSGFEAGLGKNRMDLNDNYDTSIFKTYYL